MRYDWTKYADFVSRQLESLRVPGAAVCISDDTGVLFSQGFGFRDQARTLPAGPDTIFGIASLSKSVTSLAAALLECEGKLSLDDPVSRYLPAFRIPGSPPESVLVRHLASHTTGLPPLPTLSWSMNWNTEPADWQRQECERYRQSAQSKVTRIEDIITYISSSGDFCPLGAPGEYMSYSNDGYALLSSVIDAAAGEPLEAYLERRVFEPLGMDRTTFDLDRARQMGEITSLFTWQDDTLHVSDTWDQAPPYRGCGWIKSTAHDMTKYYGALARRGMHHGKRVLPESCIERVVGRGFPERKQGVYCFGLNKRLFEDVAICEHSGGLTGVSSRGGFIKDGSFAVTVLTNLSGIDCSPISNAAFNMWLGLPLETSHAWAVPCGQEVEDPAVYAGEYRSQESLDASLSVTVGPDGGLWAGEGPDKQPLAFCGETVFTPSSPGPLAPGTALRFYVRGGQCWAVGVGSRIYQRQSRIIVAE